MRHLHNAARALIVIVAILIAGLVLNVLLFPTPEQPTNAEWFDAQVQRACDQSAFVRSVVRCD